MGNVVWYTAKGGKMDRREMARWSWGIRCKEEEVLPTYWATLDAPGDAYSTL